ncbi:MAG: tRNA 2-thiouridine(34) synthase MnmA [Pseudomonadota bacterium]
MSLDHTPSDTRVIVGMSGGVDSSVAALLLLEQGYRVEGIFMQNWEEEDEDYCTAIQDYKDAQGVCQKLGIELSSVNFSTEYWDRVFSHFLAEYQGGRTPNPDIVCNKEIKFRAFLDHATAVGADYIATGHYTRRRDADTTQLLRGLDQNKDQSYFLCALNQDQLSRALFPVGELTKTEVRDIARENGFHNHAKKDSTGICFIGERKFSDFLSNYLPAQVGEIVTDSGEVIGEHQGLMYYTLGQRQGIGIGGRKDASTKPWYVAGKLLDQKQLLVVQGHDHPLLFKDKLFAENISWCSGFAPGEQFLCSAKVRYRQTDETCEVILQSEATATVQFDRPIRAVTPGQSVVFYHDEVCLGGGIIQ